jgi:hypothetical protein
MKTCCSSKSFIENLIVDAHKYCGTMKDSCNPDGDTYKPLEWKSNEKDIHDKCDHCYICSRKFAVESDKPKINLDVTKERLDLIKKYQRKLKCADHLTGEYRGAACVGCNLKCRNDRFSFDVFFHNGKNYDFHYIIKTISEICQDIPLKIDCIPLNTEKYVTISLKGKGFTINCTDSMQFMASSLDNLVSTLVKSSNPFKYMNMVFSSDKAKMLLRKGVFPYDWYNEACKLDFDSLPPIEAFYSQLGKKHISKEDYEYAQLIWNEFNCTTFKDYMLLYLRCDVTQLADV